MIVVEARDYRLIRIEDLVRRLLRRKAQANLANVLEKMHAAEVAQIFRHLEPEERGEAFRAVPRSDHRASILSECDAHIVRELLIPMPNEQIVSLLDQVDSDDARYLLSVLPEERSAEIVHHMDEKSTETLEGLMAHPEGTAGAIMTDSYVALFEDITVEEAIAHVRKASEVENVFYVYVVDENNILRGVVSLRQLLLSEPDKRLSEAMSPTVWSVKVHDDQEHVARLVSRYNLLAMPVVDDDGALVGLVTVDDVLDVLHEEATEDILRMAGTLPGEEISALSAPRLAWVRLPWLLISWVGSIVAAYFISQFSAELSKVVALAAFIPVINGTAGNVGSQSVAIMVRGLAMGSVDPKAWVREISRQVFVGLILGACFGVVLALLLTLVDSSEAPLGLIVGFSLFAAMTVSTTLASIMPLLLYYFRFDPALMTGPFLTSSVDLISILIYFNTARLMLGA